MGPGRLLGTGGVMFTGETFMLVDPEVAGCAAGDRSRERVQMPGDGRMASGAGNSDWDGRRWIYSRLKGRKGCL